MDRQGGFTLVELLVALAVAGLVLAAAGLALQAGLATVQAGTDQADAQQSARWALDRMIQEIRGAGYDPTAKPPAYNFDAVVGPAPTSLTLQSDFNGNGVVDAQGACDPSAPAERVAYRLVGTELRRSTDPPANACEAVMVGGVSGLSFAYLDADGNPTALGQAVRTVVVAVTVTSTVGGGARSVAMTDRVRLRNR
jgi:prepilin-type N-terminal cleavage/methylation domain-containing protein